MVYFEYIKMIKASGSQDSNKQIQEQYYNEREEFMKKIASGDVILPRQGYKIEEKTLEGVPDKQEKENRWAQKADKRTPRFPAKD